MKDAIGYIRVSSEEQADIGLGLEAEGRLKQPAVRKDQKK